MDLVYKQIHHHGILIKIFYNIYMNYKIKYQKGGFNYDSTSSSDSELDTLSSEKEYRTQQLKIPIIYFDFFVNTFNKTNNNTSLTNEPSNSIKPIVVDPKCIRTDADIYIAVNEWIDDPITGTEKYCNISNWDTSRVTNMNELFKGKVKFNEDISKWNVSNVTNMKEMFNLALQFNQPLNSWNVSKVTDMVGMFASARAFNQPINLWNTSSVTKINAMFLLAASFDQPINTNVITRDDGTTYEAWDVSSVTIMNAMFQGASSFNQPLDSWDVSNVIDMNNMFDQASTFNQTLDLWDVSKVTNMNGIFRNAFKFNNGENYGLSNKPLSWNVSKVIDMAKMFQFARAFNQPINTNIITRDDGTTYKAWDVSSVTDMSYMFNGASSFEQDIKSWTVTVGTKKTNMFNGTELKKNPGLTLPGWYK